LSITSLPWPPLPSQEFCRTFSTLLDDAEQDGELVQAPSWDQAWQVITTSPPWQWQFTTWLGLLDHWQTLAAGVLALLAAWFTIRATKRSADREIAASQAQTAVAQKQIDTTVRLEQMREANEASAFRAMLEAAMTRVLAEAAWARRTYPKTFTQTTEVVSIEAGTVRQCITKGAFAELRAACLRQGSPLTGEFLDLEGEIDSFASQVGTYAFSAAAAIPVRKGIHAGLGAQLTLIETMATELRQKAAQDSWGLITPGRAEHATPLG
jgi:hypothetical protein